MDIHSAPASASRKRSREDETESQRLKREKAAERQRRKRAKDRSNGANVIPIMAFDHHQHHHHHHINQQPDPLPAPPPPPPPPVVEYRDQSEYSPSQPDLTPDEVARRDRVRAAARERQRKHRLLVKQRKMREMGNEIMPGMEEVHYRVGPDGNYQQVLSHELPPPPPPLHEPPFPPNQPPGGQTFASTLLLSFSCAPLLKQHLLRSLQMTNEELASLEPILAEAWEHWDHARRAHWAEAAKHGIPTPAHLGPPPYPVELTPEQQGQLQQQAQQAAQYAAAAAAASSAADAATHEFRARFQRPLVAPTPFRTYPAEPGGSASTSSSSAGGTVVGTVPAEGAATTGTAAIDPHLNGQPNGTAKSDSPDSGDGDFGGDEPDFG